MERLLMAASFTAALGCGVAAGVFFAFSSFVMPALGRLPALQGIAAMQAINVAAVTPAFMTALFGTAALCLALGAALLFRWPGSGGGYVLAGAVLYLVCAILVTMLCNVPRNDRLAALDPGGADVAGIWAAYLTEWSGWNHLRAAGSLAAAACFILALL